MALEITKEGNILRVVQRIYSFHTTKTQYWYYDVEKWLVSSRGKEGDTPDRVMDAGSIEWVKKYYLPKVS